MPETSKNILPLNLAALTPLQIAEALASITPEKAKLIRAAAAAANISPEDKKGKNFCFLPNGELEITLTLPADVSSWYHSIIEGMEESAAYAQLDSIMQDALVAPFYTTEVEAAPAKPATKAIAS